MPNRNRMSVATIDSPEFINISEMSNPLISKCEIKVLYVGENRNRSFITKKVATEMAKTLPGCPIVGYYMESKEDFGDHGDQVIIDGEGIKFNTLTKPYGFVAPDSKIWFQKFDDTDEFGNTVTREYLMTEGYLWTGQFEEVKRVVENGNPQSMELDDKTLKGYWSTDNNTGIDFFIINDAIFSKLCILGDDVEPCFEGASVTAPKVSSTFSNDDFTKSLFTMMAELKYALNNDKGGLSMAELDTPIVEDSAPVVEEAAVEETPAVEEPVENFSNEEGNSVETVVAENENITEEFTKKEDEEAKEEDEKSEEDSKEDEKSDSEKEDDEDEKKKYSLLESDYANLQEKYSLLEKENQELKAFKLEVEDKQKDEMIASFYMLSDEDKKDVVANKAQYSLDEIKAKLSIICVDKKVDFNLGKTSGEDNASSAVETPVVTFNLDSHEQSNIPAWLQTVDDIHNRNK